MIDFVAAAWRTTVLAGLFVSSVTWVHGQDGVVVRTNTKPESSALVGQKVLLQIDVLARDRWANLPKLPTLDVPGAVIYVPGSQSLRLNEQLEGETYTGQRYEFWIYPQRRGQLLLPSLNLEIEIKQFGVGKEPDNQSAKTDPIEIDVDYPEGVSPSSGTICVAQFDATQSWNPASESFQVGDGITRTITRTVGGAPGMLLMPLAPSNISGVQAYPKQPQVDDQLDRGSLTGTRTESVTYVFTTAGEVNLPDVEFSWWDLNSKKLRTEQLDGLKIAVAAATKVPDESRQQDGAPTSSSRHWIIVGLIVLLGGVLGWYRKTLSSWLAHWRDQFDASEFGHFRRFMKAANTGDPRTTLRTLVQWWDRADANNAAPRIDLFVERFGDETMAKNLASLQSAVDRDVASWSGGSELADQIRSARQKWRTSGKERAAVDRSCLPPLR